MAGRRERMMQCGAWRRPAACALVLAALAGCQTAPSPAPAQRAVAPVAATPPAPRSAETVPGGQSLQDFYADVETKLVANGRLRREVAPADAPYSTDDLVRDFERVALYDEYTDVDGHFVHAESAKQLRRWDEPVRVAVMTGAGTSPEDAARDRANVAAYTSRLSRLTGVDMALGSGSDVNFLVLFMTSDERTAFADQVRASFPEFAPAVLHTLRDTPLDMFCTAYAFAKSDDPGAYSAVIVMIRAEHPPLTRLSCVQEEMAQSMGLPNDSPDSRPSLFNDSLEFALLTEHDAILLRMLYDPRLRPGMSAEEARPLLPAIARDAQAKQYADERAVTQVATN